MRTTLRSGLHPRSLAVGALVGALAAGALATVPWISPREASAQTPPAGNGLRVSGTYQTSFTQGHGAPAGYPLQLMQSGGFVSGTYGPIENPSGRVAGIVAGNQVVGAWTDTNNANPGWFRFTFRPDARAFTGEWGYFGEGSGGRWNGTR